MTDETGVMDQPWCCATCSARFRWGKIIMAQGALLCPECRSAEGLQPIDSESKTIGEYIGERGTLQ